MSVRLSEKTDCVARCVPRQDGGFLIVTRKGASGASMSEFHVGAHVIVRNGQALRPGQ